jgi:arylsulfatase A-like enzyme
VTPGDEPRAKNTRSRVMLEALDTEIGKVLGALSPAVLGRTMILVLGDNGTDSAVLHVHSTDISGPEDPTTPSTAPYDPERFKNSMYEGGIRVPFLAKGPLVSQPGRAVDQLVDGVDLFRTVLSIAAQSPQVTLPPIPAVDGVDLLPLFTNPAAGPVRKSSLAELFRPNGLPVTGPFADRRREVQRAFLDNDGFKLILRRALQPGSPELPPAEVYNVFEDPLELNPLPPKEHPELFDGLEDLLAS